MPAVSDLPTINACLNGASAVLLGIGWAFIKDKRVLLHRIFMGAAFLTSTLFLASYLYYHYHAGSVRFTAQGPVRYFYFALLLSHTILAVVNLPMILRTLYLALNHRYLEHRAAARWAFPIWMFVSLSGVAVYLMLYRIYPPIG